VLKKRVERRPLRRDRSARDLRLEQLELSFQRGHPVVIILKRIERPLERIRLHFHHSRLLPCKNKKGRDSSRPSHLFPSSPLRRRSAYFALGISEFGMQIGLLAQSFK